MKRSKTSVTKLNAKNLGKIKSCHISPKYEENIGSDKPENAYNNDQNQMSQRLLHESYKKHKKRSLLNLYPEYREEWKTSERGSIKPKFEGHFVSGINCI